jgi:rRNA-processing protein FCF1
LNAPQFYVLDTNTIIDLYFGKLLEKIFQLPCKFIITDLLSEELQNPPFRRLSDLGLLVVNLNPDEVAEMSEMMGRYPKPSYYDISVFILAKSRKTILITGDEALRHAALANGVECCGTCWLINYLIEESLISNTEAIAAYDVIRKKPRYPPKDECRALLSQWKQKRKLLE